MIKDKSAYTRKIKDLIFQTGLNERDLGKRIGASPKSVYKWENGTSLPSCAHLLEIMIIIDSKKK